MPRVYYVCLEVICKHTTFLQPHLPLYKGMLLISNKTRYMVSPSGSLCLDNTPMERVGDKGGVIL